MSTVNTYLLVVAFAILIATCVGTVENEALSPIESVTQPWCSMDELDSPISLTHPLQADHQIRRVVFGEANYELRTTAQFINVTTECFDRLVVQPQRSAEINASNILKVNDVWWNLTNNGFLSTSVEGGQYSVCNNGFLAVIHSVYFPSSPDYCQNHFNKLEVFSCDFDGFTKCLPVSVLCQHKDLCNGTYNSMCENQTKDYLYRIAVRSYPRLYSTSPWKARTKALWVHILLPIIIVLFMLGIALFILKKNSWRWVSKKRVTAYYSKSQGSALFMDKDYTSSGISRTGTYTPIDGSQSQKNSSASIGGSYKKPEERRQLLQSLHEYYDN